MTTPVQAGDSLTLHFALRVQGNDQNIDSSFDAQPIALTLGDGTLETNLEHCLIGLFPHARHIFILEPQQAFGEHEAMAVVSLPIEQFTVAPPERDQLVEFTLPDEERLTGRIVDIEEHAISVDFNHILAGKTIEFEVEIITIQPRPS